MYEGYEDEFGYANHGDLGMMLTAGGDNFNMMDTSFAEEIYVFSSETDGAPNVQELYSMAMGQRPSARRPAGRRLAEPGPIAESESDYDLAESSIQENIYSLAGNYERPCLGPRAAASARRASWA